jgi:succinate dehydrogenase/fumarate reductase flavoprotein subunit
VQDIMWRSVGLFRDREGLTAAIARLEPAWTAMEQRIAAGGPLDDETWRTSSILTVARLIARAALCREESRGAHYRTDFPQRDDIHWKRRTSETMNGS